MCTVDGLKCVALCVETTLADRELINRLINEREDILNKVLFSFSEIGGIQLICFLQFRYQLHKLVSS